MTLMIDPPSGWKYGFPKPVHEDYYLLEDDFSMTQWLVSEGYPQSEIDKLGSCLLYTSPSPRDVEECRMPSSA